jgi:hypothetical protein
MKSSWFGPCSDGSTGCLVGQRRNQALRQLLDLGEILVQPFQILACVRVFSCHLAHSRVSFALQHNVASAGGKDDVSG